VLVGFAAETASADELRDYAADKLRRKDLDLVVANDVSAPGVGFGHDTNAVLILGADGFSVEVPLSGKRAVAESIVDAIAVRIAHNASTMQSAKKEHP
jgi:phosphopantothenoylcysteine decarboxylase / phosphopantothenate---cysteine ligase